MCHFGAISAEDLAFPGGPLEESHQNEEVKGLFTDQPSSQGLALVGEFLDQFLKQ